MNPTTLQAAQQDEDYENAHKWWNGLNVTQRRKLMQKHYPDCEWTFRLSIPQIIEMYNQHKQNQ
jgi:hypothetical protein